jgi:ankyrin repeat protein
LHYAASNGRVECVQLCLKIRANLNARSNIGSAERKNVDVVRLLLDAGATVNATNKSGYTPLNGAIYKV